MEMNGWKKYTMILGAIAGTVGLMATWQSLDFLPRWTWYGEHQALMQRVSTAEELIYGDRWVRLSAEIAQIEAQLRSDPSNRDLHQKLAVLQQQLRTVEKLLNGN